MSTSINLSREGPFHVFVALLSLLLLLLLLLLLC
jgi:hypothetical protein